jgi:hypothetical protein
MYPQAIPLPRFRLPLALSHYILHPKSPYPFLLYPPCFRFPLETLRHMNAYMPSLPARLPLYVTSMR